MKKRYLLLFAVFLLAFGALFTLLSAAPLQQRPRDYLEISVITRESDSSIWASIRQGMEQAANDFDVELRLVTLTETNSVSEQRMLLSREAKGGADALILAPADPDALGDAVAEAGIPVVTMQAPVGNAPCISVDNVAMGGELARSMLPRLRTGDRVVLLSVFPGGGAVAGRAAGARRALEEQGVAVEELWLPGGRSAMGEALSGLLSDPPELVIALEPAALEGAVRVFQGLESAPALCGIGSTSLIVSCLEKKLIEAIAAQNDFAAGYLAIDAAVAAAEGRPLSPAEPIGFSIVRQETMYLPENQKLLFPFVR